MAQEDLSQPKVVVPPRPGIWHLLDASLYSIAGMRRLWAETATRQEVILGGVLALVLLVSGASFAQGFAYAVLFCLMLAVEALNTAVEELTNRVSPEWSEAAKHAKDLGSLAVALMVACNVGFVAAVVLGLF